VRRAARDLRIHRAPQAPRSGRVESRAQRADGHARGGRDRRSSESACAIEGVDHLPKPLRARKAPRELQGVGRPLRAGPGGSARIHADGGCGGGKSARAAGTSGRQGPGATAPAASAAAARPV
jgi:hypothetical protein